LSLRGLAANAGVTEDAVLGYANGTTAKPRIATRQAIANALGIRLDDLPQ
jgi:transcriptional regulator with XRE-family HTH domain